MQKYFAYRIALSVVDLTKPHIFNGQKNKGEIHSCQIRTETAMTACRFLIFFNSVQVYVLWGNWI